MNHNPDTGIAFGYIRADAIDPDLWQQLCDSHGTDVNYASALADHLSQARRDFEEAQDGDNSHPDTAYEDMTDDEFDEDSEREKFAEDYQCDEPIYEGEHEGVKYRTSWLGGAPHLWVFQSPVITKCRPCSICVPGAGNLDQTGDYEAYGLPASWLTEDFIQERCEEAGYQRHDCGLQEKLDWPYWLHEDAEPHEHGEPFATEDVMWQDCYEKNLQRKIEETSDGNDKTQ